MLGPVPDPCAACGSTALEPHLRVGGDAGPEGLVPTTDRFGSALADIVRCRACGHIWMHHEEAPVGRQCRQRQGHQLGGSQSARVEQLENGDET